MSCNLAASKISSRRAARHTSSASVSAARPSPSAIRTSEARASASNGNARPSIVSARTSSFSIATGSSDRNTSTRQQGRVKLEGGIFRGGPDQHDGAILHHGEKRILLRPVEAMHLVDEQQRAEPGLTPPPCRIERLLEIGDAGEHRGYLLEVERGRVRQESRHRGLAGTWRPPEHERPQGPGLQHAG